MTGLNYPETEGLKWKQLRPSVQTFLRTVRQDWEDDYFVSYVALNELLRAYIASLTTQDIKSNEELEERVRHQFERDKTLIPINPDLEPVPLTYGQKLADKIADFGGSWPFIIIFLSFLVVWMIINFYWLSNKGFDPYPFILLNLILSCLAALQAPIIMMSQNRQEDKDRERAEYDFKVNLKAETEIRLLHEKLDHVIMNQHHSTAELLQVQIDILQMVQQRIEHMINKPVVNQ
jgi:uncharacterized membrane protein